MARYEPRPHLREAAIDPSKTALLLIDVQNFNCDPKGALYARSTTTDDDLAYWWARVAECRPRWAALLAAARGAHLEVVHTVIQSLTADGRDRGRDYKVSGFHVPPGCWDAQVRCGWFVLARARARPRTLAAHQTHTPQHPNTPKN